MNPHVRLIRQARSAGILLPLAILFGFLTGGLIVWQSWLLSGVISGVFLQKQTLAQVTPFLRGILLVVSGRVLFTILNETFSGMLAVKIKTNLRILLLEKINRLGPAFLKGEQTGELTTTALQGIDSLDVYFSQFLPQLLIAVLLPVTILFTVFPMDRLTGIVFIATAPLIPLFMGLIGRMSEIQTKRQWKALSRLGAYFLDTLQGLSTLIILGRSKDRADEVKENSEKYRTITMKVLVITFLSAFMLELVATLSTAVVAVEIGLRLLYGHIEFRQAFFILLIAPEFYQPMRNLSMRYHAGMTGLSAAIRIFKLLDTPEKDISLKNPALDQTNPFFSSFNLCLKEVCFSHPGSQGITLNGITLEIESGKHYVLVGESGAGKSTLAYLLLRFLTPDTGQITLNNLQIRNWNVEDWRSWIGWVPQKPSLFNASLLENVRLFNPKIPREDVLTALQQASLGDLVAALPDGLDTPLLEGGARLSGGEAQRIALARVFLKNSSFLILDEPTSHLDLESEKQLGLTTKNLLKGRTSITIAHRFTTVKNADKIFVLRQGELVEQGTHSELTNGNGEYARLIQIAGGRS